MDRDLEFIIKHITRLVRIHNLIGYMKTLTYEDVFFIQNKLRKIIKGIEDDLGIRKEDFVEIPRLIYVNFSKKYLMVDE